MRTKKRAHYKGIARDLARCIEEMIFGYYANWRYTRSVSCVGYVARRWRLWGPWEIRLELWRDNNINIPNLKALVSDHLKSLCKAKYPGERFDIVPIYGVRRRKHDAQSSSGRRQ